MRPKTGESGKQDQIFTQLSEHLFENVIIGAGPNGILLAEKLVDNGQQVLLIESGGLNSEEGLLTRDSYNFYSPSKMPNGIHTVGGGSTKWLGRVGQFIPSDFKRHAGRPECWPINFKELDEYFTRIFGLITDSAKLDRDFIESDSLLSKFEMYLPNQLQLRVFRFSKLSRYTEILDKLSADKNFTLLTNSTCLEISPNRDFSYILSLRSSGSKSDIIHVAGKKIIVSGGTLQSTALLMRSEKLEISARQNLLGRNLMEHFDGYVGSLVVKKKNSSILNSFALNQERKLNSREFGISFSLSDNEIAGGGLPNLHFEVTKFAKKLIFEQQNNHLDLPELIRRPLFFLERIIRKASDFIITIHDGVCNQNRYTIWMKGEEFPNGESSLHLSKSEEMNGIPKIIYNHSISMKTSTLVRTELKLVQRIISESNLGKFRIYRHLLSNRKRFYLNPNWHPMGTMRMGLNEQESICDINLQVYNNPGLYLLSAAVFPTGSNQNPTAMVMALGQRLAKHLTDAK